jgi:hypothetical protein
MGIKMKYVGTVDTPVNADQLDDLATHLTSVAELHQLGLGDLDLDMGGEITQVSFEAEVA